MTSWLEKYPIAEMQEIIREYLEKAWDEGYHARFMDCLCSGPMSGEHGQNQRTPNPYRATSVTPSVTASVTALQTS